MSGASSQVVEMLTFEIPVVDVDRWLEADREIWTSFLESQPGFVRKEMWRRAGVEGSEPETPAEREAKAAGRETIRAVIWWTSVEEWKSITPEQVAVVDEEMKTAYRKVSPAPTMRSFTSLT